MKMNHNNVLSAGRYILKFDINELAAIGSVFFTEDDDCTVKILYTKFGMRVWGYACENNDLIVDIQCTRQVACSDLLNFIDAFKRSNNLSFEAIQLYDTVRLWVPAAVNDIRKQHDEMVKYLVLGDTDWI